MQWKNTVTRWGGVTQVFHWGMFLLLIQPWCCTSSLNGPFLTQRNDNYLIAGVITILLGGYVCLIHT